MKDIEEYEAFVRRLKASIAAVLMIAAWLRSLGFDVEVMPTYIAPFNANWRDYADTGDIYIWHKGIRWWRIEVRHLNRWFTGAWNWPFRHKDAFIVSEKGAFDRSDPKPYATIIVNTPMTHVGIVKTASQELWRVEPRSNKNYPGRKILYYIAPLSCVRFHAVPIAHEDAAA